MNSEFCDLYMDTKQKLDYICENLKKKQCFLEIKFKIKWIGLKKMNFWHKNY